MSKTQPDAAEEMVPDPQVRREFGVGAMTLYRWSRKPELGFPTKIKIGDRNFRSRKQLEEFKARLLANALKPVKKQRGK